MLSDQSTGAEYCSRVGIARSVRQIVVIRDTPKNRPSTAACVERSIAKHKPAGGACAVPRSFALGRDAQAAAAVRLHSRRVRTVELTHFFCDNRRCLPVIGGALVHKDDHHLTVVVRDDARPLPGACARTGGARA